MRKLFALCLFFFCLFPQPAFAVSISINNAPSSVSSAPFSVDVSVLGASVGQNYLRVDLYKDGTSNYFGETYNGSSWYDGSVGTSYFPITIVNAKTTASASLQVRVGSPTFTEFPGPDNYKLKIRRYTSSGNAAGSDDVLPVDIFINYFKPNTPTPSPKESSTAIKSTSSFKTPTSTKIPTQPKSTTSTNLNSVPDLSTGVRQIVNNSDKIASDFAKVRNPSQMKENSKNVSVLGANKNDIPALPFLLGGLIFLVIGGGIFTKNNWEQIRTWMENL